MAELQSINPKDYVEPGTSFRVTFGYLLLIPLSPILLIVAIANYFQQKVHLAALHGTAIKVGKKQFPEIFQTTDEIAEAMGIETPEIYILENNTQNALAAKIGSKKYVVLFDDIVFGMQMINRPDALRWLLAHELAHHALGHTSLIRSQLRTTMGSLSRLDELSCDAVAAAVVGKKAGYDALKLLTVGPQLFPQISDVALDRQAIEVEEEKRTVKAERSSTHPLLLRRIARMIPDDDQE
jgi:Zn-dependent protease with chaperone function